MISTGNSLTYYDVVNKARAGVSNTKSLSFDGSNDYLDTNYTANTLFQDDFSVSLWIKPNDATPSGIQTLIGVEVGISDVFKMYLASTGQLQVYHFSDGAVGAPSFGNPTVSNGGDLSTDTFTHILFSATKGASVETLSGTITATKYDMWVNGYRVSLATPNPFFTVSTAKHAAFDHGGLELSIGASNDDGTHDEFFDGFIDEVACFTKAFTSTVEAREIYNEGVPTDLSSESGLLLYYRLEDNVNDTAGTSNGTNNGATFSATIPQA